MTLRKSFLLGSLIALLAASTALLQAQQTKTLTLEDILQTLEDNLLAYHRDIPSFLCDEHAVSKMDPGTRNQNTVTDSTFRVKRTKSADGKVTLTESRYIKTVNGHAAQDEDISGPAIFYGALSGGPVIVSLSQQACMKYTLKPLLLDRPSDPYIIEFSSRPASKRPSHCVLQEDGTGQVLIDPNSLQVTRLKFKVPNHTIYSGGKAANGTMIPPITGEWVVSIDYDKVVLEGKTFWMPTTIDAKMVGGNKPTIWSFNARYSNYHMLVVTSRILPGEAPTP